MPTYLVSDPDTGVQLELEGDSPPTESELNEIFKTTAAPKPASVGTIKGFANEFKRGLVTGQQQIVAQDLADAPRKLSMRGRRSAFVDAMTDPDYHERLIQAGDDRTKIEKVEELYGPKGREKQKQDLLDRNRELIAQDVADLEKEARAIPKSAGMQAWDEADNKNWWKVLARHPIDVIGGISMQSLAPAAPALLGNMVMPGGTVPKAIATGVGSFAVEHANAFLDSARDAGYDLSDPDSVLEFFSDKQAQAKAKQFADRRGMPIGVFDALTAGVAGRFIEPALKQGVKKAVIATGKEIGSQMAGGAAGELGGQVATGQPLNWKEIAAEAIGEIGTAPTEALSNIREARRQQYVEPNDQPSGRTDLQPAPPAPQTPAATGTELPTRPAAVDRLTTAVTDRQPVAGIDVRIAGARDRMAELGYAYDEQGDTYTPVRVVQKESQQSATTTPSESVVNNLGLNMLPENRRTGWQRIADKIKGMTRGLKISIGTGLSVSEDGNSLQLGDEMEDALARHGGEDVALPKVISEEVAHAQARAHLGEDTRTVYEKLWQTLSNASKLAIEKAYFWGDGSFIDDAKIARRQHKMLSGKEASGTDASWARSQAGSELFRMLVQRRMGLDTTESLVKSKTRKGDAYDTPETAANRTQELNAQLDEIYNGLDADSKKQVDTVAELTGKHFTPPTAEAPVTPAPARPQFIAGVQGGDVEPGQAEIAKTTGLKPEKQWPGLPPRWGFTLIVGNNPFTVYVPPGASEADVLLEMRSKVSQEIEAGKVKREDVPTNLRPPTPAQIEAGNAPMTHVQVHGLDVAIEHPAGSIRKGTDAQGKEWKNTSPADYGYFKQAEGRDGDKLDVYVGPNPQAPVVYVVDQINPETKKFDETKTMAGFDSPAAAVAAYDAAFSDGSGPARRGAVTPMSIDDFKTWMDGDTTKPVAYKAPVAPPKPGIKRPRISLTDEKPKVKPAKALTFPEFEKQYTDLLRQMMKYSPDQVGSQTFSEKASELSDAYPEWAAQVEKNLEKKPTSPLSELPVIARGDWVEYTDDYGKTHQGKVDEVWTTAAIVPTREGVKTRQIRHEFSIVDAQGKAMVSPKSGTPLTKIAAPSVTPAVTTETPAPKGQLFPFRRRQSDGYLVGLKSMSDDREQNTKLYPTSDEADRAMESLRLTGDHPVIKPATKPVAPTLTPTAPTPEPETKAKTAAETKLDEIRAKREELKARLRKKLGQTNIGVDPEVAVIAAELAANYTQEGIVRFADFARRVKEDLPDIWDSLKQYLRGAWTTNSDANDTLDDVDRATAKTILDQIDKQTTQTESTTDEQPAERPRSPEVSDDQPTPAPSGAPRASDSGRVGVEPEPVETVGDGRQPDPASAGSGQPGARGGRTSAAGRDNPSGAARGSRDLRGPAVENLAAHNYVITDADKLGQGSLKTKAQDNIAALQKKIAGESGNVSMGVPKAILNLALEAARLALKATSSTIKAVQAAIDYIKANYKGTWDESEVRSNLESVLEFEGRPEEESPPREQVLGARGIGSEYEPQAMAPIQQKLRAHYFDGSVAVAEDQTARAFNIAYQMVNPATRGDVATEVAAIMGDQADAALVLLRNELMDYAIKLAGTADQSLARYMVENWGKFAASMEAGAGTSAAARELRAVQESGSYRLFKLLGEHLRGTYDAAGKALKISDLTTSEIIDAVSKLKIDPESLDSSEVVTRLGDEPTRLSVDELIRQFGAAVGLDTPTSRKLAELVEESARVGLQTQLNKVNESEAARTMEQLKASMPKLAGWRELFTRKGTKSIADSFWKMMAGPAEPEGHVTTFEKVVSAELSRLLRQAMYDAGFEAAANPKLTTEEKIIQFLGQDPLRSDKLKLIDERVQADIAERPEEVADQLTELWDQVMGTMMDAPASNTMARRIVQETLRELKPDWRSVLTDPTDMRARVLADIEAKLRRAEGDNKLNLAAFKRLAGAQFDNIVATRKNRASAARAMKSKMEAGRTLTERQARTEIDRLERDQTEWLKPEGKKNQVREIMREYLKPRANSQIPTGKDEFVNTFAVRLRDIGVEYETGRRLGEEVWNRKQAMDAAARQRAMEVEERRVAGGAEAEARKIANRIEQTEFPGNAKKRGLVEQTISEFLKDPTTQKEAAVSNRLNYEPLRDALVKVGVSPETAERLALDIIHDMEKTWMNARARAQRSAAQRGSLRPLIERIQESPYQAQKDAAWRTHTAEDWFMANGLSRDQAQAAAKTFNADFEAKMLAAGEALARRILKVSDNPQSVTDLIRGIRAGLLDPDKTWADDIALRAGWRPFAKSDFTKLAQLEARKADESLSPQEWAALDEQMAAIMSRHIPTDHPFQKMMNESFVGSLLSGIRTMFVQFSPLIHGARDLAITAVTRPSAFVGQADSFLTAVKKVWLPEMKYAWQRDAYGFHLEAIDRDHKTLKRRHRELQEEYEATRDPVKKAGIRLRQLWTLQWNVSRALSTLDQGMMATTREWKMAMYASEVMKKAGVSSAQISQLGDAIAVARRTSFEQAFAETGDAAAAKIRANYMVGRAIQDFVANRTGSDNFAHEILKSAENDMYSMVGRRAAESTRPGEDAVLKETDEGFLTRYLGINDVMEAVSGLRAKGGFTSLGAVAMAGFINVPLRTARFASTFFGYGVFRYGLYRYRTNRGMDNLWKQSFATEAQARQRLRESLAGLAVTIGFVALAVTKNTASDGAGDDDFWLYSTGAGPKQKNLRDAWLKQGWKPYSLMMVISGHKVALPLTRVGESLLWPFGIAAAYDDAAWRRKEIAATGKTPPSQLSATLTGMVGTYAGMLGQKGPFQKARQIAQLMEGGGGFGKVAAGLVSSIASPLLIPFKQAVQSVSDMFVGPLDQSSMSSVIAANFPVVGLPFQQKAVNALGDDLYDRSWYGRLYQTGIPIAFQVSTQGPNQSLYNAMVNKGMAPPELRRFAVEEKYGPLTDAQFHDYAVRSGRELKSAMVQNLDSLRRMDPPNARKEVATETRQARTTAAEAMNLTPVKPPAASAPARVSRTRRARVSRPRLRSPRIRSAFSRRTKRPTFGPTRRSAFRRPTMRRPRLSLTA